MSYEPIEIARYRISDDITLAISTQDGFGYKEVSIDIVKNGKRVPLVAAGHDTYDEDEEVYICVYNDEDHEYELTRYNTNEKEDLN